MLAGMVMAASRTNPPRAASRAAPAPFSSYAAKTSGANAALTPMNTMSNARAKPKAAA